jgi:ECF sigma factor
MPKRKNKKRKRDSRESKLAEAARAVQSLSELRLSDTNARLLRLAFLGDTKPPEWNAFLLVQGEIQRRIESTDWHKAKGALLVLLAHGHCEVVRAIESFWPKSVATDDKQAAFCFYLFNLGMARGDPYAVLLPCAYFYQAGRYAVQEINRRWPKQGQKTGHFGMWATPVLAADIVPGDSGKLAEASGRIVSYAARRKVRRHVWDWLELAPDTQAIDTILSEWGGMEPYTAIAAALDGKLDVVTTAVKHDAIDAVRKKKSEQALFEAEKIFFSDEEAPSGDNLESRIVDDDLLARFREVYPDEAGLLNLHFLQDLSAAELAARCSVSKRTIELRITAAKNVFRLWIETAL